MGFCLIFLRTSLASVLQILPIAFYSEFEKNTLFWIFAFTW